MGLVMAMVITELIVVFLTIGMSKEILHTSFAGIALSLRPAIVGSTVMAACLMAAKAAFVSASGGSASLGVLLIEICFGALVYFLTLRIFYGKLLDDTIRLFLGRNGSLLV
jgi:hypothetical protein